MRHSRIEAWTLQIVDRVHAGQPNEDARVELKTEWPAPMKAARRLAGHANSAKGEDILWIIGLNQATGEASISAEELANWFPQVQKQFDSIAPALTDIVVPTGAGIVVALHFDTSRAPYVVKNPVAGGPVALEVPWREGTRTRSATRADLIRLLVPLQSRPEVEVLSGKIYAHLLHDEARPSQQAWSWRADVDLYVVPVSRERIVIPNHTALISLVGDNGVSLEFHSVSLHSPSSAYSLPGAEFVSTIRSTPFEALIDGPGKLTVSGEGSTRALSPDDLPTNIQAQLTLAPLQSEQPSVINLALSRENSGDEMPRWRFEATPRRPTSLISINAVGQIRIADPSV